MLLRSQRRLTRPCPTASHQWRGSTCSRTRLTWTPSAAAEVGPSARVIPVRVAAEHSWCVVLHRAVEGERQGQELQDRRWVQWLHAAPALVPATGRSHRLVLSDLCLSCGSSDTDVQHPLFEGSLCLKCKVTQQMVLSLAVFCSAPYLPLCSAASNPSRL